VTEETPSQSLAERALARLRKLAAGNGLEPAAISVMETQETDFTMGGRMEVSPLCETATVSYPGGIRGKGRKVAATFAAMQDAVAKHQQAFRENPDWIAEAVQEIKSHENQGWGLEDAKITLPQKSAIFAATETCANATGKAPLCVRSAKDRGASFVIIAGAVAKIRNSPGNAAILATVRVMRRAGFARRTAICPALPAMASAERLALRARRPVMCRRK